jgi:hypothetical protein
MPRATTAACEVMPPCAVRIPAAWMSPWMSSGVVSQRTRIDASPRLAAAARRSRRARSCRWRRRATRSALRRDLPLRGRVDHRVEQLVELLGSMRATAPRGRSGPRRPCPRRL